MKINGSLAKWSPRPEGEAGGGVVTTPIIGIVIYRPQMNCKQERSINYRPQQETMYIAFSVRNLPQQLSQ